MYKKEFKSILITGASSGIGRQLAIEYANKDTTLFLAARNKERLLETSKICTEKGSKVITKDLDITNKEELKKWILACDKIKNIDLVIANAGISAGTSSCDYTKNSDKNNQVYKIYNTNIFGVLNTIEPLIPEMIKRKSGQIVLMSSMSSFIGMSSCPAYSSSKACITSYGEALRGYLKQHNIGVSIICPGFIKTPLTDKNNFKMPLLMSVEKAAKKMKIKISKNKGMIAFPITIYILLKIVRFLPFSITNLIFSKLPKK